jgi:predicted HicB family RNase H-like nuclease
MDEATKKRREKYIRSEVRFSEKSDLRLVQRAAAAAKLSMNAWIIQSLVRAARRGLASK